MDKEHLILYVARLGLLLASFLSLHRSVLIIKSAWEENNKKKMSRGVTLLWVGIITGCMFLKMFKGG